MSPQRKPLLMLHITATLFSLQYYWADGASQVPCYFIFGDSQSDNGNNNIIPGTHAKADYRPYGIDFPYATEPTGRFTNGRNLVDFIAEFLGFDDHIPSFRTMKGLKILKGVNYASGAAGIRDETGRGQGARITFNNQLKNHGYTVSQIHGLLGNSSATAAHLKSCIYTVTMGANDFLNNYFMPHFYKTSTQFTPQQYANALTKQLTQQLKYLYGQGARKVALFGVGLIGCTPYAKATFDTKGSPCVQSINDAIQLFNIGIKSLVDDLNANLTDAKFTFIDSIQISSTINSNQNVELANIDKLKISVGSDQSEIVMDRPCCEVVPGELQCVPFGTVCDDRTKYVFWDAVHPTEIGFMSVALRAYKAQLPNDVHPYDIKHLTYL